MKLPMLSLSALALAGLLLSACNTAPENALAGEDIEEAVTEEGASALVSVPLPSFNGNPNIAAAAAQYLSPNAKVRAILSSESGLQVYTCALNASSVPTWTLRTPLAHLTATSGTLVNLTNPQNGTPRAVTAAYHYRSDFGAQLTPSELSALGLTSPPVNAPVWDVQYRLQTGAGVREVVAGRVLAQDTVGSGNIPNFFIEVRGRVTTSSNTSGGVATIIGADAYQHPISSSEYMLRWNTVRGVALRPCTSAILGAEERASYSTSYYFIDNNPPSGI